MTWIYSFGHKFAGLLVIALIRTLTESGQGLSSGLSDPGVNGWSSVRLYFVETVNFKGYF